MYINGQFLWMKRHIVIQSWVFDSQYYCSLPYELISKEQDDVCIEMPKYDQSLGTWITIDVIA